MAEFQRTDFGKRRREDEDMDSKRARAVLEKEEAGLEWPVYNHPEGGIVKITPWGMLRQYRDANGHEVTRFEDKEFSELRFEPPEPTTQYPLTPQSLNYYNPLPTPQAKSFGGFDLSPSNEVESYVMEGYQGMTPPQQYEQEHEHYFGMGDEDVTM